jgi:hypothetical protein
MGSNQLNDMTNTTVLDCSTKSDGGTSNNS